MKKNKLYTVNKFNRPMFMGDRESQNIFDGLLDSKLNAQQLSDLKAFNISATPGLSPDILGGTKVTAPGVAPKIDWSNGVQRAAALGTTAGLVSGFSDIAKAANPLEQIASSTGGLKNFFSAKNFGAGTLGGAAIGAGAGLLGGFAKNALSGGLSSGAGDTIGTLGSTIGSGLSTVNPLAGAAVTFASNLVGGAVNGLFGESVDTAKLNRVNEDIAKLNSFTSNAGSFDEVKGPEAVSMDTDVYSGGLLNDVSGKNEELKRKLIAAKSFADRSVDNNVLNLTSDQLNNALANYTAFGGPIDTSMDGAIGYGFMADYLDTKKKNIKDKNQMTNMFMGIPNSMFAFGGDMQTNSADYSVGKVYDVSKEEANRLKAMGYEFTVVG